MDAEGLRQEDFFFCSPSFEPDERMETADDASPSGLGSNESVAGVYDEAARARIGWSLSIICVGLSTMGRAIDL